MINWRSLAVSHMALFCAALADNVRGPLLADLQASFGLTHAEASWFFSVSLLASIPATIYTGRMLRLLPDVRCMQLSMMLYVLGAVGIALAQNYVMLLMAASSFGLGLGAQHVVISVMVARATPPDVRARHLSWVQVMYAVASLCAPIVVICGRELLPRWQSIFLVVALLPAFLAAVVTRLSPPGPKPDTIPPIITLRMAIADQASRFYALLIGLCITAELAISFWLALYVTHLPQYTADQAAWFVSGFFACMVVSRVTGGYFVVNRSNRLVLMGAVLGAMACIGAGLYVHPIFFSCSAFPMGFFFPVGFACLSREKEHNLEAAMSWVMCGVFVCIALGQLILGKLGDMLSLHTALHLPIVSLTLVLLMLWLRPSPTAQQT